MGTKNTSENIIIKKLDQNFVSQSVNLLFNAFPLHYNTLFGKKISTAKKALTEKYLNYPDGVFIAINYTTNEIAGIVDTVTKSRHSRNLAILDILRNFGFYGFKKILPNLLEKYASSKSELHIHKLAVKKTSRGRGTGLLLLHSAQNYAICKNKKYLSLWVAKENHSAVHLYKKFGFIKLKEIKLKILKRFYGYDHFYFMTKNI